MKTTFEHMGSITVVKPQSDLRPPHLIHMPVRVPWPHGVLWFSAALSSGRRLPSMIQRETRFNRFP